MIPTLFLSIFSSKKMQLIELYKHKEFLLYDHLSLVSFFLDNSLEGHVFEQRHQDPSYLHLSRCRCLIIHGWLSWMSHPRRLQP